MFFIGVPYKHKNNIDVGFIPTQIHQTEASVKLHGMWFLLRNFNIIERDVIEIKTKDLDNWVQYNA